MGADVRNRRQALCLRSRVSRLLWSTSYSRVASARSTVVGLIVLLVLLIVACSPPSSTGAGQPPVQDPHPSEPNGPAESPGTGESLPFSPLAPTERHDGAIEPTGGRAPEPADEGLTVAAIPSLIGTWSASGQVRTPEGVFAAPPAFEGADYWSSDRSIRTIYLYGFHRESDVERETYGMGLGLDTRDPDGLELDSIWLGLPRPGLIETYGLLLDQPAPWLSLNVGQSLRRTATSDGDPYVITLHRPNPQSVQLKIEPAAQLDGNLVLSIDHGNPGVPWGSISVEIFGTLHGQRISGQVNLTRSGP